MGTFIPEEEFDGKTFKVDYTSLGSGGWKYHGSPFFESNDLFKVGSYKKEGKVEIYADVFYIYVTKDEDGNWGEIPYNKTMNEDGQFVKVSDNGYPDHLVWADSVVVYSHGRRTPTVSVTADVKLIDSTGYRYVRIFYK